MFGSYSRRGQLRIVCDALLTLRELERLGVEEREWGGDDMPINAELPFRVHAENALLDAKEMLLHGEGLFLPLILRKNLLKLVGQIDVLCVLAGAAMGRRRFAAAIGKPPPAQQCGQNGN